MLNFIKNIDGKTIKLCHANSSEIYLVFNSGEYTRFQHDCDDCDMVQVPLSDNELHQLHVSMGIITSGEFSMILAKRELQKNTENYLKEVHNEVEVLMKTLIDLYVNNKPRCPAIAEMIMAKMNSEPYSNEYMLHKLSHTNQLKIMGY